MKKVNLPKLRSKIFLIRHYYSLLVVYKYLWIPSITNTPKRERSVVIDYHGD